MRSRISTIAIAAAAGLCFATLAGCNIIGPIVILIAGPETIETEFKLDRKRPAVVFIDDPRSQIPRRALRLELLGSIEEVILKRDLVNELIDGQAALRVADSDSTGGQMSVTELGREIGAEIVIWVTVDSFARANMAGGSEPSVSLRVRVVDATENQFLFPNDPAGRIIRVSEAVRRGAVASAAGAQSSADIAIAKKAGGAVAQLLYEYAVMNRIADRGL